MQETKRYIFLALRLLIGGIFFYAGLEKMFEPFNFSMAIYYYKLLPDPLIGVVAATLPSIEIVAALFLLFGFNTKGAAALISLLLLIFISLIIVTAIRGLDIDCGCFGSLERKVGLLAILEDTSLLAISMSVLLFEKKVLNFQELIYKILPRRIEE
jgi:putative oxidoreductase